MLSGKCKSTSLEPLSVFILFYSLWKQRKNCGCGPSSRPSGKVGWSPKKFFAALRASVWSKNKGGPSPRSATAVSPPRGTGREQAENEPRTTVAENELRSLAHFSPDFLRVVKDKRKKRQGTKLCCKTAFGKSAVSHRRDLTQKGTTIYHSANAFAS